MIPDEALQPPQVRAAAKAKKIRHDGVGKAVKLAAMPSPSYPGLGAKSLIDGCISDVDHVSGLWLGFHEVDLEARIDLGQPLQLKGLSARFLRNIPLGIYLPREVKFEVSTDGQIFAKIPGKWKAPGKSQETGIYAVTTGKLNQRARHVRVRARNVATIPAGHPAAGRKAWLFVDEVLVNPK
jgi:hexosaminidase